MTERIKRLYESDTDFGPYWTKCKNGDTMDGYNIQKGFLLHKNRLCIPLDPLWGQLIANLHARRLAGHLGRDKVAAQLGEQILLAKDEKNNLYKLVRFAKKPRAQSRTLVFTFLFLFLQNHGWTSLWVLY